MSTPVSRGTGDLPASWSDGRTSAAVGEDVRILHVDDDEAFADLVATFLVRENDRFQVITEYGGEAALERLEEEAVDCVVSDYEMPGMDGLELLERVRDRHPGLPFVLFTGKGSEEIAADAVSAGVSDYLQKKGGPDQFALLSNRIENLVRQARSERELGRRIAAVETASEGISLLDEEGRFVYVNRSYADVFGYEPQELVGEHWEVIYPERDVKRVYDELLPQAREEGWAGESRHVRKDGSEIVTQHIVSFTETGDMVCTVRNLTAEGQAGEELFVKDRAMDAAPIGITLTDPSAEDNPIVYVNEGFCRLTGYDASEALGRNCRFLQGEGTDPAAVERLGRAIDEERTASVELVNYRKDGTRFWNAVEVAPVYDEAGELSNYVGFQRDVTERKEAQREREEVLGRISDAFFALDEEWRFTYLNEQAERLLERDREALMGASVWEEFEEAVGSTFHEEYHHAMEHQEPVSFVEYYPPLSTWFEVSAYPSETGLSVYFRDVTERMEREQDLERRATQFESFADVLAHDLRSPLTVISGQLELASDTGDISHAEKARDQVDRMDDLIEDLSNVMRAGRLVGELEDVEFDDFVERTWRTVAANEATLTVESSRPLRADADALRRLLQNLLRNAVEHAGPSVEVRVGTTADGFYVEDDGTGIPAEERERVFEPGVSSKSEGSGFGMTSVRQIALAHGWEVAVTEGRDGGARFEVSGVAFADGT